MTLDDNRYRATPDDVTREPSHSYRRGSVVLMLPKEIVRHIYYHLAPVDFNAARRCCRSWFLASMEWTILCMMLRRGGWSGSIVTKHPLDLRQFSKNEWRMSRRVDQECVLHPSHGHLVLAALRKTASKISIFQHCSTIDFRGLASSTNSNNPEIAFTVSKCAKFLAVASACRLYVYELNSKAVVSNSSSLFSPGSLKLVDRFTCSRKVLVYSMSCSSNQLVITVLFDWSTRTAYNIVVPRARGATMLSISRDPTEEIGTRSCQPIQPNFQLNITNSSSPYTIDCLNYYHTVPIGDNHHILFKDPITGLLCLGTDTAAPWPMQLLPKIWLWSPKHSGSPVMYAVGSNLRHGARIAAAFQNGKQQHIWLFSVPEDILSADYGPEAGFKPIWSGTTTNYQSPGSEWMKWWPSIDRQSWVNIIENQPSMGLYPVAWPLRICGQEIGKVDGLVGLAVDSDADILVWAFSSSGFARVWKFDYDSYIPAIKQRVFCDGVVRRVDNDSDIEMIDTAPFLA